MRVITQRHHSRSLVLKIFGSCHALANSPGERAAVATALETEIKMRTGTGRLHHGNFARTVGFFGFTVVDIVGYSAT